MTMVLEKDTEFLRVGEVDDSELRGLLAAPLSVWLKRGDRIRVFMRGFRVYVASGLVLHPYDHESIEVICE